MFSFLSTVLHSTCLLIWHTCPSNTQKYWGRKCFFGFFWYVTITPYLGLVVSHIECVLVCGGWICIPSSLFAAVTCTCSLIKD